MVYAVRPRDFSLCLVVDAVERVDVPLDGVSGSVPRLVDLVDDSDEKQEENTGQVGKSDDQGIVALLVA